MTWAEWSDALSGIGDLITGLAAVGAVVVGLWQAQRELNRRRQDRLDKEEDDRAERDADREEVRATRRAEVAAQLAASVQRFLVAMQICASPPARIARDPREPADDPVELRQKAIAAALEPRWKAAEDQTRGFLEAWMLAKLHLPHSIDDLCEEIWQFRCALLQNQIAWPKLLGVTGLEDELLDAYHGAVGETHMQTAGSLIDRAFALLRSHAQLGAPDEPRVPGPDWIGPGPEWRARKMAEMAKARVPEPSADDAEDPGVERPKRKRARKS